MNPELEMEFAERRMEIESRKVEALERIAARLEQLDGTIENTGERVRLQLVDLTAVIQERK